MLEPPGQLAFLSAFDDHGCVAIAVLDADLTVLQANVSFALAFGKPAQPFAGSRYATLCAYPEETVLREVAASGRPHVARARPEIEEGRLVYRDWSVRRLADGEAGTAGLVLVALDVTERLLAAQESAEAEHQLRAVTDAVEEAVLLVTPAGVIRNANRAAVHRLGWAREELVGQPIGVIDATSNAADLGTRLAGLVKSGHTHFETVQIARDGRRIPTEVKARLVHLGGEEMVLSISRDLTERHRAQEVLLHSQMLLSESQRIGHIGSWEWEPDSDQPTWSAETYRIFGLDPRQQISLADLLAVIHPEDLPLVTERMAATKQQGVPFDLEHRVVHPDGSVRHVHGRGEAIRGDGPLIRVVGVVQDITDRKLVELSLRRLNRAMLTLSSGNAVLVHAANEQVLLRTMCQVIVEKGEYRMAWVGFAQEDADKTVRPVAWWGAEDGYLGTIQVGWGDGRNGDGPIGRVIRTGRPHMVADLRADEAFAPWREHALERGYRAMLALPLRNRDAVFGTLAIYAAECERFDEDESTLLHELSEDLSYGIASLRAHEERRSSLEKLERSMEATIQAVATITEIRDPYTAGHQRRVGQLAAAIAEEMGASADDVRGIHVAGMIHDVGKIYVPAEILNRPGALTSVEMELTRAHAAIGYDIVKGVDFPWPVAEMIRQHHERMDGSGYPDRLTGDRILLGARILAVADVVEAMASHRPYRPALGLDRGLAELINGRGRLYDAEAVDACVRLFQDKGFTFAA